MAGVVNRKLFLFVALYAFSLRIEEISRKTLFTLKWLSKGCESRGAGCSSILTYFAVLRAVYTMSGILLRSLESAGCQAGSVI